MDWLTLRAGDLSLEIVPQIGGGIGAFRHLERDIMRPASPDALNTRDPLGLACFPLAPFSNRIAYGTFTFDGIAVSLPPNMRGHPHAIHGQAWQAAWQVADVRGDAASLRYDHQAGDWPWAYRVTQETALTSSGFAHSIALENISNRAMPAGLGLHPYFPVTPRCTLTAAVAGVWSTAPDGLPVAHEAPPPAWNLTNGAAMADIAVDNCFTGWSGQARIDWPEWRLALKIEADTPLHHLVVYAPPDGDFFCVEPVSHMTDAVNWRHRTPKSVCQESGFRILQPGATMAATVRYRIIET